MKREDIKIVPMPGPDNTHKFYLEVQLDGRNYSMNEHHDLNTIVLMRDELLLHEKLFMRIE